MKIRQNAAFLSHLVKDVERGIMVPAAFQRPYVWNKADVIAMCESILEGFPLGGFLSWIPARQVQINKVARTRLGPLTPAPDAEIERLLLDGQNRLATIAWMRHDESASAPADLSPAEAATWASDERLVLDLLEQRICFVPAHQADQGFRLPARCAFGGADSNALIRARWDTLWRGLSEEDKNKGLTWWDRKVRDSFADARVVETVMENATVAEAKRAFLHICRVGVPMSEADFEAATAWTLEEDSLHG